MRNILGTTISVLFVFFAGLSLPLVYGVEEAVPPLILGKAMEYIISRVGSSYFDTYFTFNSSRYIPLEARGEGSLNETFSVSFNYRIFVKDYCATLAAVVYLDSEGSITRTEGVPTREDLMPFKIDREQAIRIAKDVGLPEGFTGYVAEIHWNAKFDAYVWSITAWFNGPNRLEREGRCATIDVNSGKLYGVSGIGAFINPAPSEVSPVHSDYFHALSLIVMMAWVVGFVLQIVYRSSLPRRA